VKLLDATNRQHTIRLAGIDAPESKQAFGQRSKQHLSSLVFDRQVTAECSKTDKYRRRVCKILVDGGDANLDQLKAGMAWHYKHYAKEQSAQDRSLYDSAEVAARTARLGLWADREPVPPWEWRHRR
jgi:endonuclease YncB( thermonuclease family)